MTSHRWLAIPASRTGNEHGCHRLSVRYKSVHSQIARDQPSQFSSTFLSELGIIVLTRFYVIPPWIVCNNELTQSLIRFFSFLTSKRRDILRMCTKSVGDKARRERRYTHRSHWLTCFPSSAGPVPEMSTHMVYAPGDSKRKTEKGNLDIDPLPPFLIPLGCSNVETGQCRTMHYLYEVHPSSEGILILRLPSKDRNR